MKILVSGGLGFVGAITANFFLEKGHEVAILDDGRDSVAKGKVQAELWDMPMEDPRVAVKLVRWKPSVILHFAASSSVGECEENPIAALHNNLSALGVFLEMAREACGRIRLVMASSCGVYGAATETPVSESHRLLPTSWYGWTKATAECLLRKLTYVEAIALRLANVAGTAYGICERRRKEDHLIPRAVKALKENAEFILNGRDWPTKDGTCIRDYVHVLDVAEAFLKASRRLFDDASLPESREINVGSGQGKSVLEVLDAIERRAGKTPRIIDGTRRRGDAAEFVASISKAGEILGWHPRRTLEESVNDAWEAAL